MSEKVIILDFGSQYTQLIARRVRELQIYCEIHPCNNPPQFTEEVKAVILSGSPYSVNDDNALQFELNSIIDKFPVLGVCYGAQYISAKLGGRVESSNIREYGKATLKVEHKEDQLFENITSDSQIWMSHGDSILSIPESFEIIGTTDSIPVAAFRSKSDVYKQPVYCIQFHPEVSHSLEGSTLLKNFLVNISGCKQDWTPAHFIETTVTELKTQIGTDKVVMGLSGGVDSTVAATLLQRAIGNQLICIFVDNGLLRKNEFEEVLESYQGMGLNIIGVDAKDAFLNELEGVSDPEKKRKIIGRVFIEVFEAEANKLDDIKWLGQGTIYPDVIESVSVHGPSATIKSHHNVGGLPERLALKIVEPLRTLFKDEVRVIGTELGITKDIIGRHPFPGPGLAIRILGPISREKIRLCQEADAIYINQLKEQGLYDKVWQAGAILLPVQSVGVMGDERTYEFTLALRCVNSVDGMTADWSKLPHSFLETVSTEIINQVKGINRVVYDISTKPPATIEWE
jgi:GMP synthase (glutamine-hydrolysing)